MGNGYSVNSPGVPRGGCSIQLSVSGDGSVRVPNPPCPAYLAAESRQQITPSPSPGVPPPSVRLFPHASVGALPIAAGVLQLGSPPMVTASGIGIPSARHSQPCAAGLGHPVTLMGSGSPPP